MRTWLVGLGLALAVTLASWGLLVLLAKRMPSGVLRDLAAFIPDCVTTVRRLRKDPRVPRRARIAVVIAGIWVASPIDLIPEFLPVIGPLDDIVVVALALRYAGRQVPRDMILAAWPGEPRLLEHLLGPARPNRRRDEKPGPAAQAQAGANRGESVPDEDGLDLTGGVEDQHVPGERVGPPPAEPGVEHQPHQYGGGKEPVDESDPALGT